MPKTIWSDGEYRRKKYDKTALDLKIAELFHKEMDREIALLRRQNENMRILLETKQKSMAAKA